MLRAFALPQCKQSDSGWGGQGRDHHLIKKFDKFQEVRFFTDKMRQQSVPGCPETWWLALHRRVDVLVVGAGVEAPWVENY